MLPSDLIALIALLISGLSLTVSLVGVYRDRGRARVSANVVFYDPSASDFECGLHLMIVNAGHRPLTVSYVIIDTASGVVSFSLGTPHIEKDDQGRFVGSTKLRIQDASVRLEEGHSFEYVFDTWADFGMLHHPETLEPAMRLGFEDSLGRRYWAKKSRAAVEQFAKAVK